jgi:hypothetical protein
LFFCALTLVGALFDEEVFMKVLIWIACFFVTALIQSLFGMKLGGIPAVMFFGATFSIAKNFVLRYDNRKTKTSKKYADSTKGLMKGFVWYGASIFYVVLGTMFNSSEPASFDFGTQIIIVIICVGLAMMAHFLIDKKVNIPYSEEDKSEEAEKDAYNVYSGSKIGSEDMTYYEMLEISGNASEEVIRMAYKALAKKYHPDVYEGDPKEAEEKMKQINEAFEILSDEKKKKQYDEFLHGKKHGVQDKGFQQAPKNKTNGSTYRHVKQRKISSVIVSVIVCVLLVTSIAGIVWGIISSQKVEWISERDFFYYEDYDEFVLVFELANKNEKAISSDGCVEITIINDDGVIVYDELHSLTKDNFEKWTYPTVNDVEWLKDDVVYDLYGGRQHSEKQKKKGVEKFLASIYIDPSNIIPSTSSEGTVYFTVYGDSYYFEELSTEVYDLPLEGIMIRTITLPDKYTAEYIFARMESKDFREEDVIAIMDGYGGEQGGGKGHLIKRGEFVEEVDSWCFDSGRKVGDIAIIENDYGYSICYISAIFGN